MGFYMRTTLALNGLSKFYFAIKKTTKDPNRYKKISNQTIKKNSNKEKLLMLIAKLVRRKIVRQNRRIALFSLWSFNLSEAGKKI